MVMAPPSWREAAKAAPASIMARVTSKFPLPISPKTWRTPCSTSSLPTASATFTGQSSSAGAQGEDAGRAARTADDRQRAGDQDRAGDRQPLQVGKLGKAVLARAQHEGVAGKGRIEAVRRAGVGADSLHPDPEDGR